MECKICTFFGHRDAPKKIAASLSQTIEQLIIEQHIEIFYIGGYGNFDHMTASSVRTLKLQHPEIQLYLIQAYLQTNKLTDITLYDGLIFPEGLETVPKRFAISHRNRWMVQQADIVVGFIQRASGGAYTAYHHAVRLGKQTINLADHL